MNTNSDVKKPFVRFQWAVVGAAILFASALHAAPLKVTLLSPEPPESLFWGEVIIFAKAVAEDLDIQLDVVYPSSAGLIIRTVKQVNSRVFKQEIKPDYLLVAHWGDTAEDLFETVAKENNTRVFVFNTEFTRVERSNIGKPRGKYANWIGHMFPDDNQGGYELADILVENAMADQRNNGLKFIALSGNKESQSANARLAGLQRRIDSDQKLHVNQVFNTDWTRDNARAVTQTALSQYPDTNVVWAVSGEVALGSIAALKASGKRPGKDVLVGSFNWSNEELKAIQKGEMVASMGGHFMEAGWALVLIYDYHNGIDFENDPGVQSVTSMQLITKSNVDEYLERFGDFNWNKIDFKTFSKTHNAQLKSYDFSLEAIFSSME